MHPDALHAFSAHSKEKHRSPDFLNHDAKLLVFKIISKEKNDSDCLKINQRPILIKLL